MFCPEHADFDDLKSNIQVSVLAQLHKVKSFFSPQSAGILNRWML
jgi:hypothetical protein